MLLSPEMQSSEAEESFVQVPQTSMWAEVIGGNLTKYLFGLESNSLASQISSKQ